MPDPTQEETLAETSAVSEYSETSRVHIRAFPFVNYKRNGEKKDVKVVNALIAQGYTHKKNENVTRTEILDVPFASLAKVNRDGDHKGTRILNAPGTSLVRIESDEDETFVKILKVPLFTLIDVESQEDGQFDRRFVKLPIIGSLFRHTRTEDETRVRFLFFSHKKRLNRD